MTKKYYISKVIGDGTESDAYRPKISDYPINSMSRTCKDEDDWCLCLVDANDHALWADDSDISEIEEF